MKKLLTSAGLIAAGISSLQAASTPDLTASQPAKPWSISAALRGFYDSNPTTSPQRLKQGSWGYEVNPSASLNLPLDQTFVGLSYEYSMRWYEARENNRYDQSHKFDARLDHDFSERYKIQASDSFVIAQEPEVLAPSGGAISGPLRTDGNNIRNLGSIYFTAQMTELLGVELGYANTFYDYTQDQKFDAIQNPIASYSALLDRDEHLASVNLRWQAMPETVGILGYQFGVVNFTSDDPIGEDENSNPVKSDIRDARSHYLYVGADHRFSSQLNGSIRLGGQYVDYYNESSSTVSPYADASLTYQYAVGSYIQGGVNHTRVRTDVATIKDTKDVTADQEVTAAYININHRITPKLAGSLLLQGQRGSFEGGTADGDIEYLFLSGVNISYQFNPFLLAEAGYNFDMLDSDVNGRDYHRNRVYIGVRATY
jgi:hypothetical protein